MAANAVFVVVVVVVVGLLLVVVLLLMVVRVLVVVVVVMVVVVVVGVAHIADIDADEPSENMSSLAAFELTHAAPHRVRLKDVAPRNIRFIVVTWETSHLDRSLLKDVAR